MSAIKDILNILDCYISRHDKNYDSLSNRIFRLKQEGDLASIRERIEAGMWMDDLFQDIKGRMKAEDAVDLQKRLLSFFESLAEKGHADAMRYVGFAYAGGYACQRVEYKDGAYVARDVPDLPKAIDWCRRAADAGDAMAKMVLVGLQRDAASAQAAFSAAFNPPIP